MARDLAIVFGLTGRTSSTPSANAVATGEHTSAWAPWTCMCGSGVRPTVRSSRIPFPSFVNSEPQAIGTTIASGARHLGAESVDVVVAPVDGNDVTTEDYGARDLARLEVRRNEHDAPHARGRRVGGDGVGQVAGRGTGRNLVTERTSDAQRNGDHSILEGVRRIAGVGLDPQFLQPELCGEPGGRAHQRSAGSDVDDTLCWSW